LRLYLTLHYLTLNWEVFEIKCAYTGIQSIKAD